MCPIELRKICMKGARSQNEKAIMLRISFTGRFHDRLAFAQR